MAYATDAQLLARVPEASAADSTARALALEDAEAWIDEAVFADKAEQAHAFLAAHLLACRYPATLGGEAGPIASMSAGQISASYAVSAAPPDESDTTSTRWGRMFRSIAQRVASFPVGA